MTDRLSPADAGFLYTEDATTPMHVGGVVILQSEGRFQYSRIVELIEARLALVPRYRQKVRFVPGRIARPVWIDDEDFDLTYHVRRSALPKPGSDAQLEDLVGRVISRPLDRTRPLWELYVVEGLSNGRIALINKTHHAMVDRVGAVDVAAAILDITPEPRPVPAEVWLPAPAPSEIDLVVDAIADITSRPGEIVDAVRLAGMDVRATVNNVGSTVSSMWHIAHRAVRPAPRSALNVAVSGQRRFVGVSADLSRLKAIRRAHGGTINDIILTVIAGALRTFLLSRGEPVVAGTRLRAMVPMSVRTGGVTGDVVDDSPVTSLFVDLPVGEPNQVIRLHQVSFAMAAHTETGRGVGADSLMELGRFAPATLHTLGARVGSQLGRRLYNILITNVPGPQIPLFAAGMPVLAMYPVAPLAKTQALAVAVTSYNGAVFFGLTSDREAMPDLEDFGALLLESIDDFPVVIPRRHPAEATADGPRPQAEPKPTTAPVPNPAAFTPPPKPAGSLPPRPAVARVPKPAARPAKAAASVPEPSGTPAVRKPRATRPAPKPVPPRTPRSTATGSEATE